MHQSLRFNALILPPPLPAVARVALIVTILKRDDHARSHLQNVTILHKMFSESNLSNCPRIFVIIGSQINFTPSSHFNTPGLHSDYILRLMIVDESIAEPIAIQENESFKTFQLRKCHLLSATPS
jgi:hypothetical protein